MSETFTWEVTSHSKLVGLLASCSSSARHQVACDLPFCTTSRLLRLMEQRLGTAAGRQSEQDLAASRSHIKKRPQTPNVQRQVRNCIRSSAQCHHTCCSHRKSVGVCNGFCIAAALKSFASFTRFEQARCQLQIGQFKDKGWFLFYF